MIPELDTGLCGGQKPSSPHRSIHLSTVSGVHAKALSSRRAPRRPPIFRRARIVSARPSKYALVQSEVLQHITVLLVQTSAPCTRADASGRVGVAFVSLFDGGLSS